jgi:hypothetical protein
LAPRDLGKAASPAAFALTERYAAVLAASACLNVWRHSKDEFLADPRWLLVALHRIGTRRSSPAPPAGLSDAGKWLLAELLARYETPRGFDLSARPVAG